MAIEYIGEVTLKAPQHIEDRLAALAEKATQGRWEARTDGNLEMEDAVVGGGMKHMHDMRHAAALHNAAPALLAVVRAARAALNEEWMPPNKRTGAMVALEDAIEALDAVEV